MIIVMIMSRRNMWNDGEWAKWIEMWTWESGCFVSMAFIKCAMKSYDVCMNVRSRVRPDEGKDINLVSFAIGLMILHPVIHFPFPYTHTHIHTFAYLSIFNITSGSSHIHTHQLNLKKRRCSSYIHNCAIGSQIQTYKRLHYRAFDIFNQGELI